MTTTTAGPTGEELKERAKGLQDLIREHAADGEKNRRIAQPVIDALEKAGLFRISQPQRYGGSQTTMHDSLEINALIAEADTSTAWVSTLINVCNWIVGRYSTKAQDEVWAENPDAKVCGVLAPSGTTEWAKGGLRLSGSWGFASGSQHADWTLLGMPIVDESGAQVDQGVALVPVSELTYKDTWYVAGMSGTGSNTFVAEDVFVPNHRIVSVSKHLKDEVDNEHEGETLYHTAMAGVLALVLAGPLVGSVQGGLDLVLASLAKGKGISYTFYEHAMDASSVQHGIADAAMLLDTARLHMLRSADCLDAHAAAGTVPTFLERARVRRDTGYAAEKAQEAMNELMSVQGAGGFAQFNPLQRFWRDLNTASRHAIIAPGISTEIYGRALLGIEEPVSPFV